MLKGCSIRKTENHTTALSHPLGGRDQHQYPGTPPFNSQTMNRGLTKFYIHTHTHNNNEEFFRVLLILVIKNG